MFDYVNRRLLTEAGVDAVQVVHLLPVAKQRMGHGTYHLTFSEEGGPFADRNKRLCLTVAGLFHHRMGRDAAGDLVTAIRTLAEADAALTPDPDNAVDLEVKVTELIAACPAVVTWRPEDLGRALGAEPALWGAVGVPAGDDTVIRADQRLASFRGVMGVEDYLRRCVRFLGADHPQQVSARSEVAS